MTNKFKPGWILTACVAMALSVLVWLGFWQLERLEQKTIFLEEIERSLDEAAISLPDKIDDPKFWTYKKVTLTGAIHLRQALCIFGRNEDNEMGVFQLAPVTLGSGQILLTNWGWLPLKAEGKIQCPIAEVDIPKIELSGILRAEGGKNAFTPEPDVAARVWYNFDTLSMQSFFFNEEIVPLLLDNVVVAGLGSEKPFETYMPLSVPNDHLQYAITWFGLALTLLGVYVTFGFQRSRKNK